MDALNLLLTGPPGVGKTTAVQRIAEGLAGRPLAGFTTEDVRQGKRRVGFRIRTFDGREAMLAHVDVRGPHRVSRYGVDVVGFEELVCPQLERAAEQAEAVLVDEVGKMECFSDRFCRAVEELADAPLPLVATVASKGGGLIADIKQRRDATLFTLTRENRDHVPARVLRILTEALD